MSRRAKLLRRAFPTPQDIKQPFDIPNVMLYHLNYDIARKYLDKHPGLSSLDDEYIPKSKLPPMVVEVPIPTPQHTNPAKNRRRRILSNWKALPFPQRHAVTMQTKRNVARLHRAAANTVAIPVVTP